MEKGLLITINNVTERALKLLYDHDPFGFVNLIAMQPAESVRVVQVKTNKFTAEDCQKYQKRTRKLPSGRAEFEVWVRVDRHQDYYRRRHYHGPTAFRCRSGAVPGVLYS
ncbi:hypothetical protein CV102_03425 [Natronococcus pandeyae]|uniref:Uncharacterized protein n=1 Tax=Natronococcus pandeyae TaxID=2055836 RepID=A0A8J8Q4X8_9EURY|nr:hypothetical protein CV102_03425 [Natronococcus pandeyae]